jgi:hypothetical protein
MDTSSKPSASGSVIAAAVVAIAGSVLTILGLSLVLISFALVGSAQTPETPAFLKIGLEIMFTLFLGVAIFGVATGAGLIRLRNWARISALTWAGVCAFFSAFGILIVSMAPFPAPPNIPPHSMSIFRGVALFVYGVPLLVSVWWLILFNRNNIKAQFAGQNIAGDPFRRQKPRCPAPIAVLAWIYIVSVLNFVVFLFLPFRMPVFLFGHVVSGAAAKIVLILSCLLFATAGVGLLKLKPWSYWLTIGVQVFWLSSGVVSMLNPNYKTAMDSAMEEMRNSMHLPSPAFQSPDYTRFESWWIFVGLLIAGAVLGMLLYYRKRFLEAAAASIH